MKYVFYHGNCPDGEMAAAIHYNHYNKTNNYFTHNTKYVPWFHYDFSECLDIINNLTSFDELVFLDVSPKPEYIEHINNNILVIDHHKNPVEKILEYSKQKSNISVYYHDGHYHSGCQLTWCYFYENDNFPPSLLHIGNLDVYNFSNPDTEPFTVAYREYFNFYNKTNMERIFLMLIILDLKQIFINNIVEKGKEMINEYREQVPEYFDLTETVYLTDESGKEYKTVSIFCQEPKYYKYVIEYAQTYFTDHDILSIARSYDTSISYSLRVINDDYTVDSIARNYGGNGHPKAAGYTKIIV